MKRDRIAYQLSLMTAVAAYGLIVVGGLVHNTGSSLACPDWPLCNDQWLPKMQGGVLFEHGHRLLAALVTLGIVGLNIVFWPAGPHQPSWRKFKMMLLGLITMTGIVGGIMIPPAMEGVVVKRILELALAVLTCVALFCLIWNPRSASPNPSLKGLGLLALVLLQALLGGATVKYHLPTLVSTAHLAASMLVLITLIYLCRTSWVRLRRQDKEPAPAVSSRAREARSLLIVTSTVVFLQIVLGALVRHTASSEAAGWGLANSFLGVDPTTGSYALWPVDPRAQLNVFHRYLALATGIMVFLCCARCWSLLGEPFRRGRARRPFWLPVALVLAQIVLGIAMMAAWNLRLYPSLPVSDQAADFIQISLRTAHLALGALLLASLYHLTILVGEACRTGTAQPLPAGEGLVAPRLRAS